MAFKGPFRLIGTEASVWRRPIADISGIDEALHDNMNMNVSPNPNHGVFEIELQNNWIGVEISVTDAFGREVYSELIGKEKTLQKINFAKN